LTLTEPRHFEDNWLFDFPNQRLYKEGAALRLRSVDGRGLLTYKGIVRDSETSPLKVREEIETAVEEPDQMAVLLERLGFQRSFRYQKYRTVYQLNINEEMVTITFDETPMGNFIEVEGNETGVLETMKAAGFDADEIIRESYPELQEKRCAERGMPLEDLVF
jgi:adenylate cyclase class 2